MLKRVAVLAAVLMVISAVPAMAKPISTYQLDLSIDGGDLSVEFTDLEVTSVVLSLPCGDGNVFSYVSSSIDGGSFVTVGPKADRFDLFAQFSADFVDCDGTRTSVTRYVQVSNFAATGATIRERDRTTGTRTLTTPVVADLVLAPLANQPLEGALTRVITKG